MLTINATSGLLTASSGLDREDSIQGRTHEVAIQVCDDGNVPRCSVNTTLFRLLDINDNSPRLSSGFTYHVNERLPVRTHVFSFIGVDYDLGANGTIRYLLHSANTPYIQPILHSSAMRPLVRSACFES